MIDAAAVTLPSFLSPVGPPVPVGGASGPAFAALFAILPATADPDPVVATPDLAASTVPSATAPTADHQPPSLLLPPGLPFGPASNDRQAAAASGMPLPLPAIDPIPGAAAIALTPAVAPSDAAPTQAPIDAPPSRIEATASSRFAALAKRSTTSTALTPLRFEPPGAARDNAAAEDGDRVERTSAPLAVDPVGSIPLPIMAASAPIVVAPLAARVSDRTSDDRFGSIPAVAPTTRQSPAASPPAVAPMTEPVRGPTTTETGPAPLIRPTVTVPAVETIPEVVPDADQGISPIAGQIAVTPPASPQVPMVATAILIEASLPLAQPIASTHTTVPASTGRTDPRRATATATAPAQAPATVPSVVPVQTAPVMSQPVGTAGPALQVFGVAIATAMKRDDRRTLPLAIDPALATASGIAPATAPVAAVGDTPQAPLDLAHGRWPHAMVDRIVALRDVVADGAAANDTRIRLVPDALGSIDVSVRQDGDTLHVHFSAEQAATATLIHDAQPRLAAIAEERGLKLGGGTVDTGTGMGTGGQPPSDGQPRRAATSTPAAPPRAASTASEAATDGRLA